MPSLRQQRMNSELQKIVSRAITDHSNRGQSLITVTYVDVSPNFKAGRVYLSVIPESEENKALSFIKRHAHEIRDYVKSQIATRTIPFFSFHLDHGERNRQRIQDLSAKISAEGGFGDTEKAKEADEK